MPTVIDLQALGDSPGTVEVVANALRSGDHVALPVETSYVTASLPDWHGRGGNEHLERFSGQAAALAFRDFSSVDDLAGPISGKPLRLLRRCWPGIPIVEFAGLAEDSRLRHLPGSLKSRLLHDGHLRTMVPRHEFMHRLLRHFPGPLLVSVPSSPKDSWTTATEVSKGVGGQIDSAIGLRHVFPVQTNRIISPDMRSIAFADNAPSSTTCTRLPSMRTIVEP
ncbi:MAG TPA: hypothetical protein VM510_11900 [Caulifigura sp.]|nr:hypothetical protein [Caulifigura sp.]